MRIALVFAVAAFLLAGAAAADPAPVVVLDPGHDLRANPVTEPIGPGSPTRKIKDGGGTRGVVSGTIEAELNLAVSLRVRTLLRRAGVRVVMTRTRTAGTSVGNVVRARIANEADAALFLRIHADGSPSAAARGTHTLYPALRAGWTDDVYAASRRAAEVMQAELAAHARLSRSRPAGARRLYGLQLGGRSRDHGRAGVHDESHGGPAPRHRRSAPACRRRPLSRHAAVPRA